jgi:rubredoxin
MTMENEQIGLVLCSHCRRCYDEFCGCPSAGVAAGTSWEDVPEDWRCPDCGTPKCYFESVDMIYARAISLLSAY